MTLAKLLNFCNFHTFVCAGKSSGFAVDNPVHQQLLQHAVARRGAVLVDAVLRRRRVHKDHGLLRLTAAFPRLQSDLKRRILQARIFISVVG